MSLYWCLMSEPKILGDGRLYLPWDPDCLCEGTGLDPVAYERGQSQACYHCGHEWLEPAEYTDEDKDGWLDSVPQVRARYADEAGSLPLEDVTLVVLHRLSKGRGDAGPRYVANVGDDRHVSWHFTAHHDGYHIGPSARCPLTQHVPLGRKAWHCGIYNDRSIGIEMDAHETGQVHAPHDPGTVRTVVQLVEYLQTRCPNLRKVCSHRSLAPGRRSDPGKLFPWGELTGLGLELVE